MCTLARAFQVFLFRALLRGDRVLHLTFLNFRAALVRFRLSSPLTVSLGVWGEASKWGFPKQRGCTHSWHTSARRVTYVCVCAVWEGAYILFPELFLSHFNPPALSPSPWAEGKRKAPPSACPPHCWGAVLLRLSCRFTGNRLKEEESFLSGR